VREGAEPSWVRTERSDKRPEPATAFIPTGFMLWRGRDIPPLSLVGHSF